MGTWKALLVESVNVSQREVECVNVLSHAGDSDCIVICGSRQKSYIIRSSWSRSKSLVSLSESEFRQSATHKMDQVCGDPTAVHTIFWDLSLASKVVKFPLEWHREIQ